MAHKWLIRPSSLGQLMAKGRTKGKPFGDTALKVIRDAVVFHKFGIEPEIITTPALEKGIYNEPANIDLASDVLGWYDVHSKLEKNRLVNDYFSGEPDINTTILADIKTNYSPSSYFSKYFDTEVKNKAYQLQLQAYMDLTGHTTSYLVYCLSDHPEHVRTNEIQKLTYKLARDPEIIAIAGGYEEAYSIAEERATGIIDNVAKIEHKVPKEHRVKCLEVKRDEGLIDEIKQRVTEAREIFDELYKTTLL